MAWRSAAGCVPNGICAPTGSRLPASFRGSQLPKQIDVRINRLPDGGLIGVVDFAAVKEKAPFITPVPGGVGPMTVTILLVNTIGSAERAQSGPRQGPAAPAAR